MVWLEELMSADIHANTQFTVTASQECAWRMWVVNPSWCTVILSVSSPTVQWWLSWCCLTEQRFLLGHTELRSSTGPTFGGEQRGLYATWLHVWRWRSPILATALLFRVPSPCLYMHSPSNSSPSDLFYPLFTPVTRSLFLPCAEYSIVPNIGKLAGMYLVKLKLACIDIMKAAWRINKPDSLRHQIGLDCNMIDLFLAHLDTLPMNFERVCLMVWEMQRVTCLLHALVDYMQIYKPRMDGIVERDPKVHDPMIMGTFVEDVTTLQHFFRARIPVWTMQPLEEAALYCIDVLTDIETPDSWLVLDQPRLKLQSVYTGAPNKAKYTAMNLFTRDHLGWANPFRLPSPVILTWPNAPLAALTQEDVWFLLKRLCPCRLEMQQCQRHWSHPHPTLHTQTLKVLGGILCDRSRLKQYN